MHFEDLWEQAESSHKNKSMSISSIIEELLLKINLYQIISEKEMPIDEKQKAKSRLLGEILLSITHLSLTDNINVFEALTEALQFHNR